MSEDKLLVVFFAASLRSWIVTARLNTACQDSERERISRCCSVRHKEYIGSQLGAVESLDILFLDAERSSAGVRVENEYCTY